MKIIGWTDWDDPKYEEMRFSSLKEEHDDVGKIIAAELRSKGYKFTGDYHQDGEFGVPVFDNGKKYCTFKRDWGDIMAMAYPDEIDNSEGYGYLKWAWIPPEPMVVPSKEDYE